MLANPHILIVEDNMIASMVEKTMMENIGCQVDCAEDGNKAMNLFKENKYDLILMDIGLPDIDGVEVTQKIRAFELAQKTVLTPIVAVTGNNDPSQKAKCMAVGMNGVYGKPFTMEVAQLILTNFLTKN